MSLKEMFRAAALGGLLLVSPVVAVADDAIDETVALVQSGKGEEARMRFTELANAGNTEAFYHLGALNHAGIGGPENLEKAIYWYNKASNAGSMEAKLALGSLLYKGKGAEQDLGRALALFTEAAEAGLLFAQYNLAMMHTAGLAHTKEYNADEDKPRAYKWFAIVLARLGDDEDAKKDVQEGLDFLKNDMTPYEITKGKEMAAKWLAAHQQ